MKNKKMAFLLSVMLLTLILTGCGSKKSTKLVCTQSVNGVDVEFNVLFNGNKISKLDFNYNMDLSAYTDEQIDAVASQDFCSIVKSSMSEYKDAFTDCKQNIADKTLKINSDLDIDKIAKSELDKMTTPSAAKEELEAQGYTCKEA